jgi:hypothetical protein
MGIKSFLLEDVDNTTLTRRNLNWFVGFTQVIELLVENF